MTNKSADLDYEIFLIDHLERFVFSNLKSYLHSPLRTLHPTLLLVKSEERFKSMIYYLHSIDLFKESEIEKQIRLYPYLDPETNPGVERDSVRKLDSEMLPKHYDEVLTAIKTFRHSIQKQEDIDKIIEYRKNAFQIYAFHQDTKVIGLVPEEIKVHLEQTQRSNLSRANDQIKLKAFNTYLENFYTTYVVHPESLWKELGFTEVTLRSIRKFQKLLNTCNRNEKQENELKQLFKEHKNRFDSLLGYLCNKPEKNYHEMLLKHFAVKVAEINYHNYRIDLLLGIAAPNFWACYEVKRPEKNKTYFYPHNVKELNDMKIKNNRIKSKYNQYFNSLEKQMTHYTTEGENLIKSRKSKKAHQDYFNFIKLLLEENHDLKIKLEKLV